MLKLSILYLLLISIVPTLTTARTRPLDVTWATSRNTEGDTITTLTFYFHNIYGGKNATAVRVAHADGPDKSRFAFGSLVIADNPLTETPDMNSRLIGRAQGMFASTSMQTSMQEAGLLMSFTFEFTDGVYSGSSFTILGENFTGRATREIPVVGGTGQFRWARGFSIIRTHSHSDNGPTATSALGFNVTLVIPNSLKNIT